jgi:hypothetical protein
MSYDIRIILYVMKKRLNLFILIATLLSLSYIYMINSLISGTFFLNKIYLNTLQLAFSIIIGILLALVIILNVESFTIRTSLVKGSIIGAILASIVNGFCCSPLIPALISILTFASPVSFYISVSLQAFFAFNYIYFYILSIGLLLYSTHKICSNLSCCIKNEKKY